MAEKSSGKSRKPCCRIKLPKFPVSWLLFFDFAFTFGTSIIYFADIVTDVITLHTYFLAKWYHAFGLSISFIVLPSIILAIMECQFLIKTYGKNIKWSVIILRTLLNIPFQLTVIWYHIKLSYSFLCLWINHIRKRPGSDPVRVDARQNSMSNLADVDERSNTIERKAFSSVEIPVPSASMQQSQHPPQSDHTWWKQLTREQWLAHLNKMKLSESMLESLPQLLINLYLIVKYPNTHIIQYLSAIVSYISLCGGVVRYDKTRKDNEAEQLMVDRTLLHSRVFATRLEIPQVLFLSLYKGCYLAARILALVYFTVYYTWNVLIVILLHWAVLMCYLVYLWYPTDINKVTRDLIQADYKYRAYMFLSQDFLSVFHNSLMGIFIHVRPYSYAFLGQPYCFIFWFYLIYVVENIVLFLLPGVLLSLANREADLIRYQYYVVLIFELTLNVLGCVLCILYYFTIHKTSIYTRNAYPVVSRVQFILCCSGLGPKMNKKWTVCKQAETSEVFFLRRDVLKQFRNNYTTVVRVNKKKGRALECFLDDKGKIFYAPRRRLFKKIPTDEEEGEAQLTREQSCESLDALDDEARLSPTDISSSVREVEVDVGAGEISVTMPVVHENAEMENELPAAESVSEALETSRMLNSTLNSPSTEQGEEQRQKNSQRSANSSINVSTDVSGSGGATGNDHLRPEPHLQSEHSRSSKDRSRSNTPISKKPRSITNTNASPQVRAGENIEKQARQGVNEGNIGERNSNSVHSNFRPQSALHKGEEFSTADHGCASHSGASKHSGSRRESPHTRRKDPQSRSSGRQTQPLESREEEAMLLQNKSSRHERKENRKSTSPSNRERKARDRETSKRSNHNKSSQQSHKSRSDKPVGQTWI